MSYNYITDKASVKIAIEKEYARTGGIFRLKPTWVARPGIVQPGRRIKLKDEYLAQNLAVNERWLASVTYSDNGVYNDMCPKDHGFSYIVTESGLIKLADAIDTCRELMLGDSSREWDVLPKFFDNWHRIPFHMHPCQEHVKEGLKGKPESYHFPLELNMNRNAYPTTPIGVDNSYSQEEIRHSLQSYFDGDNRLTDLGSGINIIPGTGYYMPPCTLHAPGSLVTYELQAASDVSCIPESRVNDMPMPPDMIDRDFPVTIKEHGFDAVCDHMMSMINCKHAGNFDNFRKEYFRPPVEITRDGNLSQSYVIYRCGKLSEPKNEDMYSAKRTEISGGKSAVLNENAAFGAVVLRGGGQVSAGGQPVSVENAAMFETREDCFADEFFVAYGASKNLNIESKTAEPLTFYQHFASGSNPDSATISLK